ncbi:hypothetical protein BLS_005625 [Venturia inaequalis]|uniref:Mitochondrial import receptor subunit tom22 n=1 Tax=Venturia inaequalis TaxID=5025 RepID=A0A8H3YTQ8_VENIN|nr:hypothetical protein BLS_005625 [Venturia inaequalis]KAE9982471.1 hypothetical protein EG328_010861 [Venturia inaequalis]KAE9989651.1 hypothetical protein EG327_002414 [Venturia inaequalis]RDI76407.1 hypothetical protein Vi05172_g13599 [Venturia inaequalis]
MVKLEEVPDEEEVLGQEGPIGGEEDWDTDSESEASDTSSLASDDDLASETLYDRIIALQDILPPSQRRFVSSTVNNTTAWVKAGFGLAGKGLWIFSTSALLIGIPWAMAYQEEVQMIEMEKEMRMQQAASDMLTPGATLQQPGQGAAPAL